jgi:hypothetical protein
VKHYSIDSSTPISQATAYCIALDESTWDGFKKLHILK